MQTVKVTNKRHKQIEREAKSRGWTRRKLIDYLCIPLDNKDNMDKFCKEFESK